MYQVQERRGAMAVYVAILDTDDVGMALMSSLEVTSATGAESRVLLADSGKTMWKNVIVGVNGSSRYDKNLKRYHVRNLITTSNYRDYTAAQILEMQA